MMLIPNQNINLLAVLVAAIVGMVVGALWYSVLFGKTWMKLMGITEAKMKEAQDKGSMSKSYLIAFLGILIMSYVLANFIEFTQATTISEALQVGFWSWLGFIATVSLGSILWECKPVKLYLINVAHQLVVLVLMSIILTLWI